MQRCTPVDFTNTQLVNGHDASSSFMKDETYISKVTAPPC